MGFSRRKVLQLEWAEGHEFHGLEVQLRLGSMGSMIDARAAWDALPDGADTRPVTCADVARYLISWNVEEDVLDESGAVIGKKPVLPTLEGLLSQDYDLVLEIIKQHGLAVAGTITGPKDETSNSGTSSAEASIPMDPL